MMVNENYPIVMTLDAGGTNFVFSAIRQEEEVVVPFALPSYGDDLNKSLQTILSGFEQVQSQLAEKPVAISFAFPGPADYVNGIIGDLGNLPAYRGGVALGPMLENHFSLPVFINNDGDLFAYGEARYGMLKEVNVRLAAMGSNKQYHNLIGLTLGTGFGGGLVRNNQLYIGDNNAAAEVWLMRNPFQGQCFVEESISIRAIIREYTKEAGSLDPLLTPFDIFNIAKGEKEGNADAALNAFSTFGTAVGMALGDIITILDGVVVIGGGLSNAHELFFPSMLSALNGTTCTLGGDQFPRLVSKVYDLSNTQQFKAFASGASRKVKVPFSDKMVNYDSEKRVGVGISTLGASKAISLGAYAYALNELNLVV
jgi:glucokinase